MQFHLFRLLISLFFAPFRLTLPPPVPINPSPSHLFSPTLPPFQPLVTVVDNLVNSNEESLRRVQSITACDASRIRFYNVNVCDAVAMEHVFASSPRFEACIHFAGLKVDGVVWDEV